MSDEEDRAWVEQHQAVVAEAFGHYMDTGEWPKLAELRRVFAQRAQRLDMEAIVNSRPRFPGELRPFHQEHFVLRFRHLRYLPIARNFLQVCLSATRRAVQVYLTPGAEPKVTSTDPQIASGLNQLPVLRAGPFLSSEQASPFAGGGWGTEKWELFINEELVMDFQNVGTFDEFVRRQEQIHERLRASLPSTDGLAASAATQAVSVPTPIVENGRIFVLMPFGEVWSQSVYQVIRIAASALDMSNITVRRADDITDPGLITDQIIAEIEIAQVVVADITGLNPNVMWELGFAHALRKPAVILNQNIHNSPFDIRNHRQVLYRHPVTAEDEELIARSLRSALDL